MGLRYSLLASEKPYNPSKRSSAITPMLIYIQLSRKPIWILMKLHRSCSTKVFFFLFFFFILCSSRPFFSSCFVTLPLLEDLSFFRRENGFKQFVGPHSFVGCFCFALLCIFSFYFGGSRVWPVTVTNGRRLLLSGHWERFVLDDLERH